MRVFCILCCVRLLSLHYLNSAKSDIAIDQFLRSILLRFFVENIRDLYFYAYFCYNEYIFT